MGLLSIKADRPEVVAPLVSYAPDRSTLPLTGPFKRRSDFANANVVREFRKITGNEESTPDPSQVFHVDRSIDTPSGKVVSGEQGFVVEDAERPRTFHVGVPTRESFLGDVMLNVSEITLPTEVVEDPTKRNATWAIASMVVELAQGNIHNPGGGQ